MFELEVKSREYFTYTDAHAYARISTDAFRNDKLTGTLWEVDEKLDDAMIPPIVDYEQLRQKLKWFKRYVDYSAHKAHVSLLRSNHDRIFLLKERETQKYVGASYLTLPKYAVSTQVPLCYRWRSKFWEIVYSVYNYFVGVPSNQPLLDRLHAGLVTSGVGEKHIHELAKMSSQELENVVYPEDLVCMLHIFTVRTDYHGRGVGRVFMNQIIEYLKENVDVPPKIPNGTPKLLLQSTPSAQNFYERLGFKCLKKFDDHVNGTVLPMATYFRNL